MDLRPIPAFYCCYLLRSTVRHGSLYIGSTPNPPRRLGQHNGISEGGAKRTAKLSLRPWEMTCLVTGFPSSIAALQFEWAWQNSHLTRKIPDEQRISLPVLRTKRAKTGRVHKKPARPPMHLAARLSNLHLLLHVPSFARWPLELRFFCRDVYESWVQRCAAMDAPGHRNIRVIRQFELDKHQLHRMAGSNASSVRATPRDPTLQRDIRDIDPTYWPIKGQVEAGQALEAQVEDLKCACCKGKVDPHLEMVTICPEQHCQAPSHMACLSQRFLESEPSQEVLPIQGQCPKCESALKWVDLVKELTLRMRGEKEIKRLMKPSKKRAASGADPQEILLEDDDDDLSPEEFDEDLSPEDVIDEPHKQEVDDLMRDTEWETFSASSWASEPNSTVRIGENNGLYRGIEAELSPVIEDSDDWASAEVLE